MRSRWTFAVLLENLLQSGCSPVEGTITPGGTVKGGAKPDFAVPFTIRNPKSAIQRQ